MQLVDKEKAHWMIDNAEGEISFTTYNRCEGISKRIQNIKKTKGRKLIDRAKSVIQMGTSPIIVLDLSDKIINDLENYAREGVVKQLLLYIKQPIIEQKIERMF